MTGFPRAYGESRSRGAHQYRGQRRPCRAYVSVQAPAFLVVRELVGIDAALEEYRDFMAAGMLEAWRARWRHVLGCG